MIKHMVAGVALTLLMTSGIEAQAHPHRGQDSVPSMSTMQDMMMGSMMGHGMMGQGMMQMMGQGMGMMASGGPGPAALLHMRDALDLSEEQVQTLESMRDDLRSQMQGRMAAMMSAHQAISAAVQPEAPDWNAYEESLRAAADIMVQTHLVMARAAKDARDVLTAEQREELETRGMETMQGMMHRMWRNRPGGMMEHRR